VNFSAVTYSLVNGIDTLNDNLGAFKSITRESFGLLSSVTTAAALSNAKTYMIIIHNSVDVSNFYKPTIIWGTVHGSTLKYSVSSDDDNSVTSITLNANSTLTIALARSERAVVQIYSMT
jgi:hypothetical protein